MFKKLLIGTVSLLLASTSYVWADEGAGCGLGKQIWSGQSGLIAHISAATTNGTSANQLFGLTSGTSGCDSSSTVLKEEKVHQFVATNFENLKENMVQGQGEYLTSLATLMELPNEQHKTFFNLTLNKYDVLISSVSTTPQIMLKTLNQELSIHPTLSQYATL